LLGSLTAPVAGNTIIDNGGNGIFIYSSSTAYIGGNTIRNGSALNSIFGWYGIFVVNATASLAGGNIITENVGSGISALSSHVRIGEQALGSPTRNTITGNGTGPDTVSLKGGVYGNMSTLSIFDANISNNTGNGITLQACSTLSLASDVTVTGNSLFGLQCNDANFCSKVAGNTSGISGNTEGQVSESCIGPLPQTFAVCAHGGPLLPSECTCNNVTHGYRHLVRYIRYRIVRCF
jgi:parallel beta-helix repeat protein